MVRKLRNMVSRFLLSLCIALLVCSCFLIAGDSSNNSIRRTARHLFADAKGNKTRTPTRRVETATVTIETRTANIETETKTLYTATKTKEETATVSIETQTKNIETRSKTLFSASRGTETESDSRQMASTVTFVTDTVSPADTKTRRNTNTKSRQVTASPAVSGTKSSAVSATRSLAVTESVTLTKGTMSNTHLYKTPSFVVPDTFTHGFTDSPTLSASMSNVITGTQPLSASLTASLSQSMTQTLSLSGSAPTASLSRTVLLTNTKTLVATDTQSSTFSMTESLEIPATTSVPPPTTTLLPTPTRTMLTDCPYCANGTCTDAQPFLCVCWKDTRRGFWLGGREEGEGCWDCLPAYYGPTCLNVCPGGRCSPCSLHGTCDSGVLGNGTCSCFSDPVRGYWTGASCQNCQPERFGPDCRGVCNCSSTAIKCFDGLTGNGTCLCPEGRDPPDCKVCADGRGGPSCTKCPGETPCSNHGVCHKTFGNCTCDQGWSGLSCNLQCTDCGTNPCKNNGIVSGGVCVCPKQFRGPSCEYECPVNIFGEVCGGRGTCVWSVGSNATCNCDNSPAGFWGGANCTECAEPHLSLANNCSAPCRFDTSHCPVGYQGFNCTVRCGDAPLTATAVCSNRGVCNCYGQCYCNASYGGSYCQTHCPVSGGEVCGGPTRGYCFDRTGNATCKCIGKFVGAACESKCNCEDAAYGDCIGGSSICICKARRAGVGCQDCAQGWRGDNCSSPCVNGITVGRTCVCNAFFGGLGCTVMCSNSSLGVCSGPSQGLCLEGENQTGTCACLPGYYGPSCNCTQSLCQQERPLGSVTCDTSNGQCICAAGFGGAGCADCQSESYWGAACNELCSCQHGTCGRESGECTCYKDSVNGYWTGELCDECVQGYLIPECKLVSSITPQITSLQMRAPTTGRNYIAQKIFYDPYDDAIIISGQFFARFDGSLESTPRNISKSTAFMMTGCANILGSFTAANNTRLHTLVNCNPIASGQQRIDFISASLNYPNPFTPLEIHENSTVTLDVPRPLVPVPRFKIVMTATEILSEGCFLAYYRGGKVTAFGQVNGESDWDEPDKTRYNSSREIQCLIFKSQVTDGGSERLLKLACVPIDPPLQPAESDAIPTPSISRRELFVAAVKRTDTADGYTGDSQGVVLYYSDELDGILIGAVTDIGTCTIHFIPASFHTDKFIRLYRNRDCKKVSALLVKDGFVIAGIRKCEGSGCAVTRPTVIRFRPTLNNDIAPAVMWLAVEPLLPTDFIVAFSFDELTSSVVVTCRSASNYYKILRILSTSDDFMVVGSQTSSSADPRGVADALVVTNKRVLMVLHRAMSGVALRRYALIEAMSISPEISDRRGGTVITVSGRGFVAGLGKVQCRIGNSNMNGTVVDTTRMLCESPIATGTSCTVDTVDVSIYNGVFTVNRLPLRRIDFPKLRSATPDLQRYSSPQPLQAEATRADESLYTKCKYAAITRANNGTTVFNGTIITNGSSFSQDGRLLIRCDPPAHLLGSTVAALDVALDGTVFSNLDASELPVIRYLGDPISITPTPANIRLSSAMSVPLPRFTANIVDVSTTEFGTRFEEIVKFFVTPVLPPPLSGNTTATGQIEGVPAVRLSEFLHTDPIISSGERRGRGVFSGDDTTDQKIVMVNPVQGVVHLVVNLTSVFDAAVYPWSTSFIVTVFPGSIQKLVITREPGDTITTDGLVNDVELQIQDAAGNIVVGTQNVTIGAAVVERFLGGDPTTIPRFITDKNPPRPNPDSEALVASSGTATFKSLRLNTRGMYSYALRFYIAFVNESVAFLDYKTANRVDPVNMTVTTESIAMLPSCNLGDVRTIGSYTCEPCLENADCSDGSSIYVSAGFWRSSAYSSQTFACTPSDACLGGIGTGTCAEGYGGPKCSVCAVGYGKSAIQGVCEECPGTAAKLLVFILLCLGFALVIGLTVVLTAQSWRRQSTTLVLIQIFVDHMQTIMMIGSLDLQYPPFFLRVMTYCGIFTLQLLDFAVSDCIVREGGNYFTKFFVYAVMALLCFFAAAVAWVFMFIFPNIFRDNMTRRRQMRRVRTWAREVKGYASELGLSQRGKEELNAIAAGGPTKARPAMGASASSSAAPASVGATTRKRFLDMLNPKVIDEEMAIALEGLTDDESDAEMQVVEDIRRLALGKSVHGKDAAGASLASLRYTGGNATGEDDAEAANDRNRKRKDPSVILKNHSFRLLSGLSLQVIMFFTLPSIVYYSLSMFNCTDVKDPLLGDRSYMNVDMSVSCDDSAYQSMHNIGIAVACLYLILAPLIYLFLYWRDLRYFHFHIKRRAQVYAFAMMGMKSSQWFWPAAILLKKSLIACCVVLLGNPMDSQILMWILVLFIVGHVHLWPYLSNRINYIQMFCLMSQLFGLCTSYFLDMIEDEIAVAIISAVTLIILLTVALAVLFYAAHHMIEMFYLNFRVHILGDNLTESQSTDSFHLNQLDEYREGLTRDHIPLPEGEEDNRHIILSHTGELLADVQARKEAVAAKAAHEATMAKARGDPQALLLMNSMGDPSGVDERVSSINGASAGSGGGSHLASPLLLSTDTRESPSSDSAKSPSFGDSTAQYSPPAAPKKEPSEAMAVKPSQAPATPSSTAAKGGKRSGWDHGKDHRQFGVDVEALQLDEHFNTNYPSRSDNMLEQNSPASGSCEAASDKASSVLGSTLTNTFNARTSMDTTLTLNNNNNNTGNNYAANARGMLPTATSSNSGGTGDSGEKSFVSLMPNSEGMSASRRRRGRRGDEDAEEATFNNGIGFDSNTSATAGGDGDTIVPAFATYSSKLSEAMLAAEQRAVEERRVRLEEAHRQALLGARGNRAPADSSSSLYPNSQPQSGNQHATSGVKPPGFLGDDAQNTINYASYMRRLKRAQGNNNASRFRNFDSDDSDI